MTPNEVATYLSRVFSTPGDKYTARQFQPTYEIIDINDHQRIDATESGYSKLDGGQRVWILTKCVILVMPSDPHCFPRLPSPRTYSRNTHPPVALETRYLTMAM